MSLRSETWALVLAAGDGTRLSALTYDVSGKFVPKQFCSLAGGQTLLQDALHRAARLVPRERICAIVARQHEQHWRHLLRPLAAGNVIVQPLNCGTAHGVVLGALRILERDARARIVFLPSDHYVREEAVLAESVRKAVLLPVGDHDGVTLIGIEPDAVDTTLGYIVPGEFIKHGVRRVAQFVEKPSATAASELIARGAVWNSFIFAAHARTLLAMVHSRSPEVVGQMTAALACLPRQSGCTRELDALYERLPVLDFSRAIVQGAEAMLRLCTAPACGWADLGTPQSVAQTLERHGLAHMPGSRAGTHFAPRLVDLSMMVARSSTRV